MQNLKPKQNGSQLFNHSTIKKGSESAEEGFKLAMLIGQNHTVQPWRPW